MTKTFKGAAAAILLSTLMATSVPAQDQGQQMQMKGPGMQGMGGCPMADGMQGMGIMGRHMGMMGPGMMGQGMGQGMGPGMMMRHGPMLEGRLAYLKAELEITDAQAAAWDGYAGALRTRASAMQSTHAGMMKAMQSGTALERIDAHIAAMQKMVEALGALKPATEALYNVLSDDQKKKADTLLGMGCGMM